jgi:hypothetical protein
MEMPEVMPKRQLLTYQYGKFGKGYFRAYNITTPKLLAVYDSVHFFSVPYANTVQLA